MLCRVWRKNYIVEVAESINIKDICEARCKTKILKEAWKHVPWIALGLSWAKSTSYNISNSHIRTMLRSRYLKECWSSYLMIKMKYFHRRWKSLRQLKHQGEVSVSLIWSRSLFCLPVRPGWPSEKSPKNEEKLLKGEKWQTMKAFMVRINEQTKRYTASRA